MVGEWLAFAPDNELGGFYMGMAACEASGANQNMPIVFMKGPPNDQQVCTQSLSHALNSLTQSLSHALNSVTQPQEATHALPPSRRLS